MTRLLTLVFALIPVSSPATTLFINGHIRTSATQPTLARWMAVTGGKVVALGSDALPPRFRGAHRVNLHGRFVFPGLTDAHAHLGDIGEALFQPDLSGAKSAKEAAARVRAFLAHHRLPASTAVVGNGWDQSDWPGGAFPERSLLDALSTKRPIILYRVDGHAAWVNTKALERAGLLPSAPPGRPNDPKGGHIVRDSHGQPTGILVDAAMHAVAPLLPPRTPEARRRYYQLAVQRALSLGITGAHDPGVSTDDITAIRELRHAHAAHFRFYEMVRGSDEASLALALKNGVVSEESPDGTLTVRAVKLFADGAMGSRGAAFATPYDDDPGNRGLLQMTPAELEALIRRVDGAGFQVAVHAIGSLANHVVIDAFEKTLGTRAPERRPRLEHAQVLEAKDIPRLAHLGIIASMQPKHCTSDAKWVVARIGRARARYAYAWRSLLDAHARLAFGSDAPVDDLDPWHGVFAAVTRETPAGEPRGGFFPEERISRREALAAYTSGAAFAAFAEKSQGSLEPGRWADFAVLDSDPLTGPTDALKSFKVRETYVGGEKVWPSAERKEQAR